MASCDLYNNINPVIAIPMELYSDDGKTDGKVINMQGYESVVFTIITGENPVTDGDFTFELLEADLDEETNTPGSYTPVDPDNIQGAFPEVHGTESDLDRTYKVGYVGNKQFLQLVMNAENTDVGLIICVIAVQGHPRHAPTPEQPTLVPVPA